MTESRLTVSQEMVVNQKLQPKDARGRHKRRATVYDAVAGRTGINGFVRQKSFIARPLAPQEALLKRKGAPERLSELDEEPYFAAGRLGAHQALPNSSLVKAAHTYACDHYALAHPRGSRVTRSMDETALLAMGILLEEVVSGALSTTGELAFVEARQNEHGICNPVAQHGERGSEVHCDKHRSSSDRARHGATTTNPPSARRDGEEESGMESASSQDAHM